jgi:hypothetical protein
MTKNKVKRRAARHGRVRWDGGRGELYLSGKVIRKYTREAPGQMAVLAEFEAKHWTARINAHALVPKGARPKTYIANTVKNLNRAVQDIRFHADGPNSFIRWTRV